MAKHVDFERYQKFVDAVTSDASTDFVALSDRLVELDEKGANIERLLTAGVGLNAEGGEFLEIIKKMIFQGKPWNEDNKEHLIIELGDLMWYAAQACMALGVSFDEVVATNVKKLEKRYPGGQFDVYYSENREVGDRCKLLLSRWMLAKRQQSVKHYSLTLRSIHTIPSQFLNVLLIFVMSS